MLQIIAPLLMKLADLFFADVAKREQWKKLIDAQVRKLDRSANDSALLRIEHDKLEARLRELENKISKEQKP